MANHLSIKPSHFAVVSRTLTVAADVSQTVLLQAGVNVHSSPPEALEAPLTVIRQGGSETHSSPLRDPESPPAVLR